jgi:hypothetical protein
MDVLPKVTPVRPVLRAARDVVDLRRGLPLPLRLTHVLWTQKLLVLKLVWKTRS